MIPSKNWDADSLKWLISGVKMNQPQPEPVGTFFGFVGMPATISVTKKDGMYVDGKKAESQPEPKEQK